MTQFLRPRQVFENFFDLYDLLKNLFAACFGFLAKAGLSAAKPSIMTQFFGPQPFF
jgi:hypothetical protein